MKFLFFFSKLLFEVYHSISKLRENNEIKTVCSAFFRFGVGSWLSISDRETPTWQCVYIFRMPFGNFVWHYVLHFFYMNLVFFHYDFDYAKLVSLRWFLGRRSILAFVCIPLLLTWNANSNVWKLFSNPLKTHFL